MGSSLKFFYAGMYTFYSTCLCERIVSWSTHQCEMLVIQITISLLIILFKLWW